MTTLYWPRRKLCGPVRSIDPVFRNTSGGGGRGPVVASDAGVWKASLGPIPVLQRQGYDGIALWQAISALLEGRAGEIAMPVETRGRRPLPAGVSDDVIDAEAQTGHDDDSLFDDGTGYVDGGIEVELAADAALRATTLFLAKGDCGTLAPGMDFSIGVRLYRIRTVVEQTAASATVTINFPLREAAAAGMFCDFALPVCLMRLASDQEMDLAIERNKRALPTVNLVEAV